MGVERGVNELLRKRQIALQADLPERDPFSVGPSLDRVETALGTTTVHAETDFGPAPGTTELRPQERKTKENRFVAFMRGVSDLVMGTRPEAA